MEHRGTQGPSGLASDDKAICEIRGLAVEHPGHVPAERLNEGDDNRAVEQNLDPADDSHGRVLKTAQVAVGRR